MSRKAKAAPVSEIYDEAPAVAEAEEETVVETPAKPEHSPRILQLAADFGISREEADEMGPDRLSDLVFNLSRRAAKTHKELRIERAQEIDRQPKVQEPAAPPDEFAHLRGKYDDEIVNEFSRLAKENKSLQETQTKLIQETQARDQQTYMNILDDAFADLGADYGRLLGSGGIKELAEGSPELQRRKAIFTAAGIDFSQRPGSRTVAQKIKAAAQLLLGHQIPPAPVKPEATGLYGEPAGETRPRPAPLRDPETGRILPKAAVDRLEADVDWATETVRPTHRRGANEPQGVGKATRNLAAKLAELGSTPDGAASGYATKEDFL